MTLAVSNYVSPEELTLWLAEKQNDMYADMRNAIDLSNQRSEMQSALADIKRHLQDANANRDFHAVSDEIAGFLEKYADTPEFQEISQPLVEIKTYITNFYESQEYRAEVLNIDMTVDDALPNDTGDDVVVGSHPNPATFIGPYDLLEYQMPVNVPLTVADGTLQSWLDSIDAKCTYLSQQDQLAMITIQELNGKINQSEQLVSNLIASQNQTLSGVISNIRG